MRRRLILSLVLVGLLPAGAILLSANPLPATNSSTNQTCRAEIKFDSTTLDFGKAAGGQIISHIYHFTNTGNQALEIKDVRPTCGCTIAGSWDNRVAPGGSGIIPIRFTVPNKEGVIVKTVIVLCNDPAQTNVVLQIKGTIWEPIQPKPPYLVFGVTEDLATNQTRTLRIINREAQPLKLSEPTCTNGLLKASLHEIQPGKEYELLVTLVPPVKPGTFSSPIAIGTSSTNIPQVTATTFVNVQPILTATPSKIALPPGPLREAFSTSITIQNHSALPVALTEANANNKFATLQLREAETKHRYELTATFPAGFKIERDDKIEIQIKTDHPAVPIFKLPVTQNQHLSVMLNENTEGK